MFKISYRVTVVLCLIVFLLGACSSPSPAAVEPTKESQAQTKTDEPVVEQPVATLAPTEEVKPTEPLPTEPVVEPTQAPAEPRVFSIAIFLEVTSIDPAFAVDWQSSMLTRGLYDPLFRMRGDPIQAEPWLAESYEVSTDLTVWTLHLRKDVKFHDGSPINAEAVKYSFDRLMALQAGYSWLWADLITADSVKIIDDSTIEFTLTKPFPPFVTTLGDVYVVNPKVVKEHEQDGDWGKTWLLDNEAGSGPYVISRWEPGSLYELTQVPDHWAGFAHDTSPNVFRYVVYRESTPARLALEAGDVQWFPGLNEEDFTLLKEKDGIETLFRPSLTLDWIFMNTASEGPLGDANVRKALRHAFDYAAADAVLFDLNGTNYVMPPSIPGAVEFPDIQKTDLDLAKEYLAKSQWPDGGFELNYIYIGGYSPEQDAGLVLLEAASKLNITVKMIPKTWSEMVQMCSDTTTIPDMVNIYIGAAYSDPDPYFSQAFSLNNSNGFANCHRYLKQELSDKLSQASTEPDAAKRTEMYNEIQQEVYDSAFGILIGTLDFIEAHDSHWQADSFTPLFAYLGYIPDYYYVP